MKRLFLTIALFLGSVSLAWADGGVLTGNAAKQMENILSWMVFNPQGEARDGKVAYIIGGLRCPYTANIINRIREIPEDLQIRWVFPKSDRFDLPGAGFVMTEKLPDAFISAGRGEKKPDTREQQDAANFNAGLFWAMSPYGLGGGFPTILYPTKDGIRATSSLDDLIREKDNVIPFPAHQRAMREMVAKAYQKEFGKKTKVENNSKQVMNAYFLPDEDSPMLDSKKFGLQPGQHMEWACADYNSDFFMCLNPYNDLRFFYKKNK